MSDQEDGPNHLVNDNDTSKDVELHNPNLIEESDEYEEVDDTDAEPFKDSPEEELKQAVYQQPVSVAFQVVDGFSDYTSGVTIPVKLIGK